jgi:hypothetical protein
MRDLAPKDGLLLTSPSLATSMNLLDSFLRDNDS